MPDFHVSSLAYKIRASDSVTYLDPPPVSFETEDARLQLSGGKLRCEMKVHFATEAEARAAIEPILRAWEADADLQWNRGELRFEFERADVVDRSPVLPGENRAMVCFASAADAICLVGKVTVHVGRARYPEPPRAFRINPDVESLLQRYRGHLDGHEPLLSMAYFCLTLVESKGGNKPRRASAAARYRIDQVVLSKLAELTSTRGDHITARKVTATPIRQLSGPEGAWVEAAVKMLIWRLGDIRKTTDLPLITLSDLPNL